MNNQFTTVISYEKSAHAQTRAGGGMLKGEAGSLLKALAFMALWAVLTGLLVIEPLMSSPAGASFKQDRVNFTQDSPVATSVPSTTLSATPSAVSAPPAATALVAVKPSSASKPPPLRQPAGSGYALPNSHTPSPASPQLSAQAAFSGQPFQLSYALLSVK